VGSMAAEFHRLRLADVSLLQLLDEGGQWSVLW
jgi:hypothetical protein